MTINRRSLFGFFAAAPAIVAAAAQPAGAAAMVENINGTTAALVNEGICAATWQLELSAAGQVTGVIVGEVQVEGNLVYGDHVWPISPPEPNQALRDAAARYKALKS